MTDQSVAATHKFVVALNKKIETGRAMNAAAHMMVALVHDADEDQRALMSVIDYADADAGVHRVSGLSLVVLEARNSNQLRMARATAQNLGLLHADFLESMTGDTYREQLERTAALPESELEYFGVAIFGPAAEVNECTGKFSIYKG